MILVAAPLLFFMTLVLAHGLGMMIGLVIYVVFGILRIFVKTVDKPKPPTHYARKIAAKSRPKGYKEEGKTKIPLRARLRDKRVIAAIAATIILSPIINHVAGVDEPKQSDAPVSIIVPIVVDKNVKDAAEQLTGIGFKVKAETMHGSTIFRKSKYRVIEQRPEGGTSLDTGETVTLVGSRW